MNVKYPVLITPCGDTWDDLANKIEANINDPECDIETIKYCVKVLACALAKRNVRKTELWPLV